MQRIIDWTFTVPFLLVFGAILAVFDPVQRVARMFGSRPHELVVGMLQLTLLSAFKICGTKLEVDRSPKVRPWTSYLLIANHQSMFDIPILGGLLFSNFPKYVSKKELARWIPSISYNLRRGGNAVIDRGNREQAVQAIRQLGESVRRRGVSAVIYPEGTRARTGEIGVFKKGGVTELIDAAPDVPIVPVAVDESWKLLRYNLLPVPFGTRVRVYIGDPIARRKHEDRDRLLLRVHDEINAALRRWRNERAEPRRAAARR